MDAEDALRALGKLCWVNAQRRAAEWLEVVQGHRCTLHADYITLPALGALQETAAIIIEPILGEGGFLTPPPGFLSALRTLCDKHGMLLIFDEVRACKLDLAYCFAPLGCGCATSAACCSASMRQVTCTKVLTLCFVLPCRTSARCPPACTHRQQLPA